MQNSFSRCWSYGWKKRIDSIASRKRNTFLFLSLVELPRQYRVKMVFFLRVHSVNECWIWLCIVVRSNTNEKKKTVWWKETRRTNKKMNHHRNKMLLSGRHSSTYTHTKPATVLNVSKTMAILENMKVKSYYNLSKAPWNGSLVVVLNKAEVSQGQMHFS